MRVQSYLGMCGKQGGPRDVRHFLIMGLNDPVGAPKGVAGAQGGHLDGTKKLLERNHSEREGELPAAPSVVPTRLQKTTEISFST